MGLISDGNLSGFSFQPLVLVPPFPARLSSPSAPGIFPLWFVLTCYLPSTDHVLGAARYGGEEGAEGAKVQQPQKEKRPKKDTPSQATCLSTAAWGNASSRLHLGGAPSRPAQGGSVAVGTPHWQGLRATQQHPGGGGGAGAPQAAHPHGAPQGHWGQGPSSSHSLKSPLGAPGRCPQDRQPPPPLPVGLSIRRAGPWGTSSPVRGKVQQWQACVAVSWGN